MSSTVSVTLTQDVAEMVRAKVAAGEYASESDVIRDGLRILEARNSAVSRWLHEDVAKGYDEYKADPNIAIPASQVSASLDERFKKANFPSEPNGVCGRVYSAVPARFTSHFSITLKSMQAPPQLVA